MSFETIEPGFNQSLLGTAEISKFSETRPDYDEYYRKGLGKRRETGHNINRTVSIIIITAIIFVIIISYFDVIRNIINSYYISKALRHPNSNNTPEDIIRTEIADQNAIVASIIFAIISTIIGLIIIYFVMTYFWKRD